MSKTPLSPLQRAYWMGYRRAKAQMRRELDEMGRRWDHDLAELEDGMRAAHEQTARSIDDEIAELADEMLSMGNEFRRWQAIEKAIATERDPNELLN